MAAGPASVSALCQPGVRLVAHFDIDDAGIECVADAFARFFDK
ncbi:hypothetical protein [Sterolibacterium denitrificans]|nr:hypothetical protein [Sterolibacterium denitrificans]